MIIIFIIKKNSFFKLIKFIIILKYNNNIIMFTYQKLVNHKCFHNVDKDSLSIIEKFSIFYTPNDNIQIYNFLKKNIIKNYDLNFFTFLMFNIKSLDIFNTSKDKISVHFRINHFINFSLLEDEIYDIIKSYFINSHDSIYDIKSFIKKYFWNHILTDRFQFIQNPHRWEYLENSIIFIHNILIKELKISQLEMDSFINFIQINYNFNDFYLNLFNLNFENNLKILNLDFGYTQEDTDIERMIFEGSI